MTTVQQILVAAYGLSSKNRPGTIATEATELLQVVIRSLRGLYALAPSVNPTFFAGFADVMANAESGGPDNTGWVRPPEAEAVFRLERTTGTIGGVGVARDEVMIVPYDDVKAEVGLGAVYRLGQTFFPAGNPNDPTGGELRLFFSRRPDNPASVEAPLDSQWTAQFDQILILDVAAYLAGKDGRDTEVQSLLLERKEWISQFVAFLGHTEINVRARFGQVRRVVTNALSPV